MSWEIETRSVTKRFGAFVAVADVSLQVQAGELVALLGPSGSGKTTLLRIVAGLESPDEGRILYGGEDVTTRPVRQRNVGFVFQQYALFDHMTVFENIAFGLRVRRVPEKRLRARVDELVELTRLGHLVRRLPSQLSGGQRQRVALARALAPDPRLLLLDEPFGALDAKVRQELREWLRRIHAELHVTSLFVTHDQTEAFEIADRVAVMNAGRVVQVGTPEQVYAEPADAFIVDFLGHVNVLTGEIRDGVGRFGALLAAAPGLPPGPAKAYLRHAELDVVRDRGEAGSYMAVRIARITRAGPVVRLELVADDHRELLGAQLPHDACHLLDLQAGETIYLRPRRLRIFSESGEGTPRGSPEARAAPLLSGEMPYN